MLSVVTALIIPAPVRVFPPNNSTVFMLALTKNPTVGNTNIVRFSMCPLGEAKGAAVCPDPWPLHVRSSYPCTSTMCYSLLDILWCHGCQMPSKLSAVVLGFYPGPRPRVPLVTMVTKAGPVFWTGSYTSISPYPGKSDIRWEIRYKMVSRLTWLDCGYGKEQKGV